MIGISGFGYGLSVAVVSFLLIWGLRVIGRELQKPADPSKVGGVTVMREVISDKEKVLKDVEPPLGASNVGEASFSRVAGAIGAVSLAATFVGVGYWVVYALFFDIGALSKLGDLRSYFLSGAALFAPYAFNQLASVFKT